MLDLDDDGFEGTTEAGATLYHAPTTPEIAHDASAADVEELLETLPSLGQVCILTMCVLGIRLLKTLVLARCTLVNSRRMDS